jgi:hypothetical protein
MQSEAPQTIVGVPSNRLSPLWLVCLGSGLVADLLAAIGGELTYEKIHFSLTSRIPRLCVPIETSRPDK